MKIAGGLPWLRRGSGALSAAAGLLCGIHCVALPAFTAALLALGLGPRLSVTWEVVVMLSAVALGLVSFLPRATQDGNPFPLQAAIVALLLFLAGWRAEWLPTMLRQSCSISASLMLLVAHAQNLRSLQNLRSGQRPCVSGCG